MTDPTKPGKSCIADSDAIHSLTLTHNCEYSSDDKALKKKLKKERQKDKRNQAKTKSESVSMDGENNSKEVKSDFVDESEVVLKEEISEQDITHENVTDMQNLTDNEDSESTDINFETMVSAFVRSIVSQKDIVKKQKDKGKDFFKHANHKLDNIFTDDTDGFIGVKKGTKQVGNTFCRTPEGFGNEALRVIQEDNFQLAIHYLTRGIALDSMDARHYINRSYCYLRCAEYSRALADIRKVNCYLSDILGMSKAKCREGQALCGLKDYEAAELAFRESINLAPDFSFAKRELKRMQIQQIVDMGFKERDVLRALENESTTGEAIDLLSEESLINAGIYDRFEIPSDDDDDEIFYSDTEEDPSNERLLSKLIKYDPNSPEEPRIPEPPPPLMKEPVLYTHSSRAPSQERALRVIKAVPDVAKSKKIPGPNDLSVWIGGLTPQMTSTMIQKRFSRFGKVLNVWWPPNEKFGFVNFQCPTATEKALDEANCNGNYIEMNGTRIFVKPKTIKAKHK